MKLLFLAEEILARYASGRVAAHEFLHFLDGYLVEVAVNGMFQAGSGNCEVERFLVVGRIGQQTVNQTAHE